MPARSNGRSSLPETARDNTPDAIERALKPATDAGLLPPFPFGSDFTEVEQRLLPALQTLKSASQGQRLALLLRGLAARNTAPDLLDRLGLAPPRNPIGMALCRAGAGGAGSRAAVRSLAIRSGIGLHLGANDRRQKPCREDLSCVECDRCCCQA